MTVYRNLRWICLKLNTNLRWMWWPPKLWTLQVNHNNWMEVSTNVAGIIKTYFTAFWHFCTCCIPFCTFLVIGWLNFITYDFSGSHNLNGSACLWHVHFPWPLGQRCRPITAMVNQQLLWYLPSWGGWNSDSVLAWDICNL